MKKVILCLLVAMTATTALGQGGVVRAVREGGKLISKIVRTSKVVKAEETVNKTIMESSLINKEQEDISQKYLRKKQYRNLNWDSNTSYSPYNINFRKVDEWIERGEWLDSLYHIIDAQIDYLCTETLTHSCPICRGRSMNSRGQLYSACLGIGIMNLSQHYDSFNLYYKSPILDLQLSDMVHDYYNKRRR